MSALQAMYRAMADQSVACAPLFTSDPFQAFDSYPSPANAGIEIEADGTITRFTSTTNNILIGRWDGGCGSLDRADYDFRADRTGGSGDFDGFWKEGIWYPGSGLISFSLLFTGFGIKRIFYTLRMRPTGGGVDIDTAPGCDIELDLT